MQQTGQDLEIWPKERDKTWTITKTTEKMIEGTYTRMLRAALNVSWRDYVTNDELHGSLPNVSVKIRGRRMRLAGHCVRYEEEEASKLVLWQPLGGRTNRGKRKRTYIEALLDDTGLATTGEIRTAMMDRRSDCIFESYSEVFFQDLNLKAVFSAIEL